MPKQARRFLRQLPDTTPRDVGRGLANLLYRATKQFAIRQVAQEVGARVNTIEAIAERKAYDEIGGTEVGSWVNSAFADQPRDNRAILAELYETHPWIFVAVHKIATAIAGIPLRIMRAVKFEDGKEILENADDSPVGRMFRWANPYQSPRELIESIAAWRLLCGEAFVVFTEPGPDTPAGIPGEMYPLFTPFVEKMTTSDFGVVGYRYRVGAETATFHASRVWRVGSFSPAGRWRGQGHVAAGIKTIQTDNALRAFNLRVIRDGVHLSGILETDNEDLNPDDAKKVRKEFEATYGNRNSTSNVAVLWGGLRFSPQTILQKDIMMPEQVAANRDEILALYGIKPELVTDKFANKATAETVRRMFYEDVVLGEHGAAIADSLSATALQLYDPDLRAKFDPAGVPALQVGEGEKSATGAQLISSGQMTINEVRQRIHGMSPLEGIEGDIPLINGRPIAAQIGPGDPEDDGKFPAGTAAGRLVKMSSVSVGVTKASDAAYEIAFQRLLTTKEASGQRILRGVYRDLQDEILKALPNLHTEREIVDALESIYMRDGRVQVAAKLADGIRGAADASIEMHLQQMSLRGAFKVAPTRALRRLANQESRLRDMMGRRYPDLRTTLKDGLLGGESEAAMKKRVDDFFGGLRNNSLTVARTEMLPAINGSAIDVGVAARKAGVLVKSVWRTNGDEMVRRPPDSQFNHAAADGQKIIPGEEMFLIGGEHLEYPGDSWNGASPGNTIGCRCGIRNKVEKGDG